ncbi:pgi, partial [Acrasis kona]
MSLLIVFTDYNYSKIQSTQGIILCVLTLIATSLFSLYYIIIYVRVKRSKYKVLVYPHIQTAMRRFQLMSLIYFVFLTMHAVSVVVLDQVVNPAVARGGIGYDAYYALFALYMLGTEVLPLILIIIILMWPKKPLITRDTFLEMPDLDEETT